MSEPRDMQPSADGSTPRRRPTVIVYAAELVVGMLLGLVSFLLLLWLLDTSFPDATGLGEMVRSDGSQSRALSLELDGKGELVIAQLVDVQRDVRERAASSVAWTSAGSGRPLYDRHAVQSFEGSGATIAFDAHNALELAENSLVVVRRPRRSRDTGRKQTSILFTAGFIRARLGDAENDLDMELVTGSGVVRPARIGGELAEVSLAEDPEEGTAVVVHKGAAEVVWQDQVTVVQHGQMVTFDEVTPPSEPMPLPEPPRLMSPLSGQRYRYREAPPRIPFRWWSGDDTAVFRLQIARDPAYRSVAYEDDLVETEFVHGNLEAGTYFWRVQGKKGAFVGAAAPSGRFTIERDGQPPKLEVEFPPEQLVARRTVVRGVTDPDCRVVVGEIDVPTGSDGRFEIAVDLEPGYNFLVVQALDSAGNTAFANQTVIVSGDASEGTP